MKKNRWIQVAGVVLVCHLALAACQTKSSPVRKDSSPETTQTVTRSEANQDGVVTEIQSDGYVLTLDGKSKKVKGKVPKNALFAESVLAPKEYQLDKQDIQYQVDKGYIIKIKDKFYYYPKEANSNVITESEKAIPGVTVPTSDGFQLTKDSKILAQTKDGIVVDHDGHSHFIFYTDLKNTQFDYLIPASTVVSEKTSAQVRGDITGANNASKTASAGHHYEFNPADIVAEDEFGYMVRHEDHYHYILKSSLGRSGGTGTAVAQPTLPVHSSGENTPIQPVAPVHSTLPVNPVPVQPTQPTSPASEKAPKGISGIDYPTSDGFLFDGTGMQGWTDLGLLVNHDGHTHLLLKSDLAKSKWAYLLKDTVLIPLQPTLPIQPSSTQPDSSLDTTSTTSDTTTTSVQPTPAVTTEAATVLSSTTTITEVITTPNATIRTEPTTGEVNTTKLESLMVITSTTNSASPVSSDIEAKRAYLAKHTGRPLSEIVLIDTPEGKAFMYPHEDHYHVITLEKIDVTKPFDDGHGHHEEGETRPTTTISVTTESVPKTVVTPAKTTEAVTASKSTTTTESTQSTLAVTTERSQPSLPAETSEVATGTKPITTTTEAVTVSKLDTTESVTTPPTPTTTSVMPTEREVTKSETTVVTTSTTSSDLPMSSDIEAKRAYLAKHTGRPLSEIVLIDTPEGKAFMYPHEDHYHVITLAKVDVTKAFDDGHGHHEEDETRPTTELATASKSTTTTTEAITMPIVITRTEPTTTELTTTKSEVPIVTTSTTEKVIAPVEDVTTPTTSQATQIVQPSPPVTVKPAGIAGIDYPTSDGFLFDGTGMQGWTDLGLLVNHKGHTHIILKADLAKSKWAHLLPTGNETSTSTNTPALSEKLKEKRAELAKSLGLSEDSLRPVVANNKIVGFEYPHEDHYDMVPISEEDADKKVLTDADKRELTAYIRKAYGLLMGTPVDFKESFVVFAIPHPHQDYDKTRDQDYYSDKLDPQYDPGHVHPYTVPLSRLRIPEKTGIPELDFENELLAASERLGIPVSQVKIKDGKYFVLPGKDHDHYLNIFAVDGLKAYTENSLPAIKPHLATGDFSKGSVEAELERIDRAAKAQFGDGTLEYRRVHRALNQYRDEVATGARSSTQAYLDALQSFEKRYVLKEEGASTEAEANPLEARATGLIDRVTGLGAKKVATYGTTTTALIDRLKSAAVAKDSATIDTIESLLNAIKRTEDAPRDQLPRVAYLDFFLRHVDSEYLTPELRERVAEKILDLHAYDKSEASYRKTLESTVVLKNQVKAALATAEKQPIALGDAYDKVTANKAEMVGRVNHWGSIFHYAITAEEKEEGFDRNLQVLPALTSDKRYVAEKPAEPTQPENQPTSPSSTENDPNLDKFKDILKDSPDDILKKILAELGGKETATSQPEETTTTGAKSETDNPTSLEPVTSSETTVEPKEEPETPSSPTVENPLSIEEQHAQLVNWLKGLSPQALRNYKIDVASWESELEKALSNQDLAMLKKYHSYQVAIDRVESQKTHAGARIAYLDYFIREMEQPYLTSELRERLAEKTIQLPTYSARNFKQNLTDTVDVKALLKVAASSGEYHDLVSGPSYEAYLEKKADLVKIVADNKDYVLGRGFITDDEKAEGFGKPYPEQSSAVKPIVEEVTEVAPRTESSVEEDSLASQPGTTVAESENSSSTDNINDLPKSDLDSSSAETETVSQPESRVKEEVESPIMSSNEVTVDKDKEKDDASQPEGETTGS